MKTLLKIILVALIGVFLLKHFSNAGLNLKKANLLPLDVKYVQGAQPPEEEPLLLEFWATWCPPCRESIPHMNTIYAQYHKKGLNVTGVSSEDAGTVAAFMRQMPMNYPVALDPQMRYGRALNVTSIPHAFLINRKGKVIWDGHPMEMTDADIEKVLAQ